MLSVKATVHLKFRQSDEIRRARTICQKSENNWYVWQLREKFEKWKIGRRVNDNMRRPISMD